MCGILTCRRNDSMYHAMGYSSILTMQAGMTFDPKDMETALTALQEALVTCQRCSQVLRAWMSHVIIFVYGHSMTWVLSPPCLRFRRKVTFVEVLSNMVYRRDPGQMTEGPLHCLFVCGHSLLLFLCSPFVILNLTFIPCRGDACWTVLCWCSIPKSCIKLFRGTVPQTYLLSTGLHC